MRLGLFQPFIRVKRFWRTNCLEQGIYSKRCAKTGQNWAKIGVLQGWFLDLDGTRTYGAGHRVGEPLLMKSGHLVLVHAWRQVSPSSSWQRIGAC